MIAGEFLRVGASQQSWDQNFPSTPSVWVPGPAGPVLDPDFRTQMEAEAAKSAVGASGAPALDCPPGTVQEYVNGRWQCTAVGDPGGRVVDPEEGLGLGPSPVLLGGGRPTSPQASSVLPPFIGGVLGKIQFTQQDNRNIGGIRFGVLPRVIFDEVPGGFGGVPGLPTYGGSGGGHDVISN